MKKPILISVLLGIAAGSVITSMADVKRTSIPKSVTAFPVLKSGDLIFRSGKGFVSGIMRNTSLRDRTFSHVGLVVLKDGNPMIYHMMDKIENGKSISRLWCESLDDFCSNKENFRVSVYRYVNLNPNGLQLENEMKSLIALKPAFDDHFDLSTDHELYCTEFVWKYFLKPSGIQIQISHTATGDFVGLDDLYLNPFAHKIFDIKFES